MSHKRLRIALVATLAFASLCSHRIAQSATVLYQEASGFQIRAVTAAHELVMETTFVPLPAVMIPGLGQVTPSYFQLGPAPAPGLLQAYVDIFMADAPQNFTGIVGLRIRQTNGFIVGTLTGAAAPTANDAFETVHFPGPIPRDVNLTIFSDVMQPGLSLAGLVLLNQVPPNLAQFDLVFGINSAAPINPALPIVRMTITQATYVPEPESAILLAMGAIGLAFFARTRR